MSATQLVLDAPSPCVLSVAVIGPDEQRRAAVTTALAACLNSPIREFLAYPARFDDSAQMLLRNCDVVIVDLDSDIEAALDLVECTCIFGTAIAMVYSTQADPDLMVRCMRAGAREFLPVPFTVSTLAEALSRASVRRTVPKPLKQAEGSLLVFLGSKDGAGVTTLACNFALLLAEESGKSTLLIDLNLPLGDAAINLGIKAPHSTVDALQNSSRLDSSFLSTLIVQHSSGLSVLAAPSELVPAQASNDAVDRLLEIARQKFNYVVVDAGSRLDLQRTVLFNESTAIYLVTQVGVPELRNANRLIAQFSQEGSPKLEIVINRYEAGALGISEEHMSKALTRLPNWKVPNNYAAVRRMQNTATPLALENSPISRTIRQMARTVCGKPDILEKKKNFSFLRSGSHLWSRSPEM